MSIIEIVKQLEGGVYHNETTRLVDDPAFIALKKHAEDAYNLAKAFETIGNILTPDEKPEVSKWRQKLEEIQAEQMKRMNNKSTP